MEVDAPGILVINKDDVQIDEDDPLGRGGYGTVYRGFCEQFGGLVAVKTLIGDGVLPKKQIAILRKEAEKLWNACQHDSILKLLGLIMEKDNYSLILEYMHLGSLSEFRKELTPQWPLMTKLARDVMHGMDFLHSQTPPMLHLDLKADNVLIDKDVKAKLCDFGLSEWKTTTMTITRRATDAGRPCTVTHIPPEIWSNVNAPANKAYDIYSFGIVMWELLSGKAPYGNNSQELIKSAVLSGQRPDFTAISRDCPKVLTNIMTRSWNQQALQRPQFSKLKEDIEPLYNIQKRNLPVSLRDIRRQICQKFFPNAIEYMETAHLENVQVVEEPEPVHVAPAQQPGGSTHAPMDTAPAPVATTPIVNPAAPFQVSNKFSVPRTDLTFHDKQIRKILRDPLCMQLKGSKVRDNLYLSNDGQKILQNNDLFYKYLVDNTDIRMELDRSNHAVLGNLYAPKPVDTEHQGEVDQKERLSNKQFEYHRERSGGYYREDYHYEDREIAEKKQKEREERKKRSQRAMGQSGYANRLFIGGMGERVKKALKSPWSMEEHFKNKEKKPGEEEGELFDTIDPQVVEACQDPIMLQILFAQEPSMLDDLMRHHSELLMKLLAANKHSYRPNRGGGGGGGGGGYRRRHMMDRDFEDDMMMMHDMDSRRRMRHMDMDDDDDYPSPRGMARLMKDMMKMSEGPGRREPMMPPKRHIEPMSKMKEERKMREDMEERQKTLHMLKRMDSDKKKEERMKEQIEEIEKKRKKEIQEREKDVEKKKKEDEKRMKKEEKKQSAADKSSSGNSYAMLNALKGVFSAKSKDSSHHTPISERTVRSEMASLEPDQLSRSVPNSATQNRPQATVKPSIPSSPTKPAPDPPVSLVSMEVGSSVDGPKTVVTSASSARPKSVGSASLKEDRKSLDEQKLETDAGKMDARPDQGGASGSIHDLAPGKLQHIHKDGGFTQVSWDAKQDTPSIQVGSQNVMHVKNTIVEEKSSKPAKKNKNKKKVKLTTSEKPLTRDDIDSICSNIGKDSKRLCRELGFQDGEIDQMHIDFHISGTYEIMYQAMQRWFQREVKSANKKVMAEKLSAIDRDDLAKKM